MGALERVLSIGKGWCGPCGEVLIEMLKCSNQLVPRVERFGSRTLRRWLEHRREKHDEGMWVSGVPGVPQLENGKIQMKNSLGIGSYSPGGKIVDGSQVNFGENCAIKAGHVPVRSDLCG